MVKLEINGISAKIRNAVMKLLKNQNKITWGKFLQSPDKLLMRKSVHLEDVDKRSQSWPALGKRPIRTGKPIGY